MARLQLSRGLGIDQIDVNALQDLAQASTAPTLILDATGHISLINDAARHLFGDWVLQRSYVSVIRQPELLGAVERGFYEQTPQRANFLHVEGEISTEYLVRLQPIHTQNITQTLGRARPCLAVVFENTSHEGEMATLRSDFVANVSHELKSPITAISGFIETLQGPAKGDAQITERFLELMGREAARMDRLVSDLLSLSKLEAQARRRPQTQVDLAQVISHALDPLLEQWRKTDAQVLLDIPENALMPGDFDQLVQVLTNLVENALKYGGRPAIVHLRLTKRTRDAVIKGPAWDLEVQDNGAGVEAYHLPRLTERFYRVDSHRAREQGGTGLGLAIVKHIVNRHRGRMKISSEKGVGTRFILTFPAR